MTATDTAAARNDAFNAYSADYIQANRLQYNDVDEQNDGEGIGYWYVEIDLSKVETYKGCACGCRNEVRSAKRHFLPGHDQRLMGILVRAHREGMEVAWTDGGVLISADPATFGQQVLNERGQAKLANYLANEPKRARRRTTAAQAAEIIAAPVRPEFTTVKIGRWEYPVVDVVRNGDGEIVAVEYTNKQNAIMKANTWGKLS